MKQRTHGQSVGPLTHAADRILNPQVKYTPTEICRPRPFDPLYFITTSNLYVPRLTDLSSAQRAHSLRSTMLRRRSLLTRCIRQRIRRNRRYDAGSKEQLTLLRRTISVGTVMLVVWRLCLFARLFVCPSVYLSVCAP